MAIDTGSMLMKLNPLSAIQAPGGGGGGGMERERLRLMREQFEYQKQRNIEEDKQARLKAKAEAAAAAAAAEEARAAKLLESKQAAYAKFTELNGQGKIEEARSMVPLMSSLGMGVDLLGEENGLPAYAIEMDAAAAQKAEDERMAQASPYDTDTPPGAYGSMEEGMGAPGPETAEQSLSRMGALGYPANETGNLDDPSLSRGPSLTDEVMTVGGPEQLAGVDASVTDALTPGEGDVGYVPSEYEAPSAGAYGSMEEGAGFDRPEEEPLSVEVTAGGVMPASLSKGDAYAQALDAGQRARDAMGLPARAPDEEDYTGAVPKNVLDTGASYAQTLRRLDPMMAGLASAMPDDASKEVATKTGEALRHTGLPLTAQLDAYGKAINEPISVLNAQTVAKGQQERQDGLSLKDKIGIREEGFNQARARFNDQKLQSAIDADSLAETIKQLLEDPDPLNDMQIGPLLLELSNVKGTPSDTDLNIALGIPKGSLIDKAVDAFGTWAAGGIQRPQKDALLGYAAKQKARQRKRLQEFMGIGEEQTNDPNQHEEVRAGWKNFLNTIPRQYRDEYETEKKKKAAGGKTASTGGRRDGALGVELDRLAKEAGLSGDAVLATVGGESQGDAGAVNGFTGKHGGILQFSKDTWEKVAKAVGTPDISWDDMLKLSPVEQAPYAIAYLKSTGLTDKDDAGEYAMATFMPDYRKKPDGFVLGEKDSTEISFGKVTKGKVWEQNPSLRDGDKITVGGVKAKGRARAAKGGETAKAKGDAPSNESPADKRARELLEKMGAG
jgi:hypothetical protein